jgi:hypothetical protein
MDVLYIKSSGKLNKRKPYLEGQIQHKQLGMWLAYFALQMQLTRFISRCFMLDRYVYFFLFAISYFLNL